MDTPPSQEVISVSTLNRLARGALQERFPLLWVGGEISGLTRAASGHVYFTLKDDTAQVRCTMFRNRAQALPWRAENGQQVEVQALVTLYEPRGDYQLNVESMRRAGIGRLYEAFARLRQKLADEGLFDLERKKPLPQYPRRVGIVTSTSGAAIHDIVSTFLRRAPHVELLIFPSLVQGDAAPAQICTAIDAAVAHGQLDVLIVARGGGSIEDLWAFNDEQVARRVASAPLPVVSGVGHETDTTICDLAADVRAATPTAAAELVSAAWLRASAELAVLRSELQRHMRSTIESRMQRVDLLARALVHPGERLARLRQTVALAGTRLNAAARRSLSESNARLAQLQIRFGRRRFDLSAWSGNLALLRQRLHGAARHSLERRQGAVDCHASALAHLSPQATLERGYSIVRDAHGIIVRSADQLAPGGRIDLSFAHGGATADVVKTTD
jgi:exodeoxyribonuclease VII large subunit